VVTYAVVKTHVKAATYVPMVGLFAGGATSATSVDMFAFGPTGVLTKVMTSDTAVECKILGGCGSVQASGPVPTPTANTSPATTSSPAGTVQPEARPAIAQAVPVASQPPNSQSTGCVRVVTDQSQSSC
jgi:hypothetical protein